MALRELPTNVEYVKWTEELIGKTLKAFFLETKPSRNYPDQNNHYVETLDGERLGLNGNKPLDGIMSQMRPGWYIELTYTGMRTMESGKFKGKDCHTFKIAYDDERIHPLFSGDAAAREDVEYKNSEAPAQSAPQQDSPPALVKPEQSAATPPAASAESAQKRRFF